MNAVINSTLPAPVARRGITESQWWTMANNLFPGARAESVLMVWDYCAARKLDPLKKPCHIVPMYVRDANGGGEYRDVVMPGIYEYRTTANRTGQYMGHSRPVYGPEIEHFGVKAPEWCEITVYRWNAASSQRVEFPVTVYFVEAAATRKDKKTGEVTLNDRWGKAPRQMLTKCAEAAGLREAFPDELGGEHTAEEIEGHGEPIDVTPTRMDPRGDVSGVDWELRDKHVSAIADLCSEFGSDEAALVPLLKDYVNTYLREFQELFITVADKLAADGILSKANFRKLLK
jgi:phage recombination protein Bet